MGELLGKRVGIQTLGMSVRREEPRVDGCSDYAQTSCPSAMKQDTVKAQ
jgi:hypothetical protein